MRVLAVSLRDFRCYEHAEVEIGEGLTVVTGPNGAGKTRVVVRALGEDGPHELAVGFEPGQPKRMRADGAPVERLLDVSERPLVSVFLPDRLELIKGPPSLRRAHLDQFVSAMWPARSVARRGYAQA